MRFATGAGDDGAAESRPGAVFHQRELDDDNWSCHESGHVELIEIAIDIRESVHHGIHEYVHRDERQCGHYGKMHVMTIAAHVILLVSTRNRSTSKRFRAGISEKFAEAD